MRLNLNLLLFFSVHYKPLSLSNRDNTYHTHNKESYNNTNTTKPKKSRIIYRKKINFLTSISLFILFSIYRTFQITLSIKQVTFQANLFWFIHSIPRLTLTLPIHRIQFYISNIHTLQTLSRRSTNIIIIVKN